MPKKGGRRTKKRSHRQYDEEAEENIPKTFVFKRGKVADTFKDLVKDTRNCMYPNTAMRLQDSQKLKLSAYVRSSKHYGVTHLIAYHTRNESNTNYPCNIIVENYVRFIKNNGPVLTFKIINYCRGRDVLTNVEGAQPFLKDYHSPLLVMNNFSHPQVKGLAPLIQGMFPPLNMETMKPEYLKRVISFTYKPENGCVYFRHYKIKMVETGISEAMKTVINNSDAKHHMDLSGFRSFSDYFLKGNNVKQQEQSGEEESGINSALAGSGKIKHTVKLHEIGPRLKLKFFRYDEKLNIKEMNEEDFAEGEEEKQVNDGKEKQMEVENQQANEQVSEISIDQDEDGDPSADDE